MRLGQVRRPRNRSLDDALLPLVNVVFLLMIFFLSASRLGAARPAADAPRAATTDTRSSTAAAQVLELRDDSQLAVQDEVFTEAELPGRALAWQGAPLDVRAAGSVPAERVLRVLAALRGAGVSDVRLLTVRSTP